jgi:hypothetical protein
MMIKDSVYVPSPVLHKHDVIGSYSIRFKSISLSNLFLILTAPKIIIAAKATPGIKSPTNTSPIEPSIGMFMLKSFNTTRDIAKYKKITIA